MKHALLVATLVAAMLSIGAAFALAPMDAAAQAMDPQGAPLFNGLRVRMGAHIGSPDPQVHPTTGRMDYFGPMVNTTARIANAPHSTRPVGWPDGRGGRSGHWTCFGGHGQAATPARQL